MVWSESIPVTREHAKELLQAVEAVGPTVGVREGGGAGREGGEAGREGGEAGVGGGEGGSGRVKRVERPEGAAHDEAAKPDVEGPHRPALTRLRRADWTALVGLVAGGAVVVVVAVVWHRVRRRKS